MDFLSFLPSRVEQTHTFRTRQRAAKSDDRWSRVGGSDVCNPDTAAVAWTNAAAAGAANALAGVNAGSAHQSVTDAGW